MRRTLHVLLVLACAACARPPAPSPEYAEARRRHAELVGAHPADAASRAEMDEVLALLARVPAASADAAAAAELRARVEADRSAQSEERRRRQELLANAAAPPPMPAGPAAPPPPATRPAAGTKLADFRAAAGECFERKAEVELVEGGKARAAEAWGLGEGEACAARHPADAGQWLLFADGAYVTTRPAAEAKRVEQQEQKKVERVERVEVAPLPGGGYGRKTKDGKVEPLPKDATLRLDPPAKETKK